MTNMTEISGVLPPTYSYMFVLEVKVQYTIIQYIIEWQELVVQTVHKVLITAFVL